MVEPQNQKQTQMLEPIYPQIKRSNFIGISKYYAVQKASKRFINKYVQAYGDLPGIFRDHRYFEMLVTRFGFSSDEFLSLMEPKMKDCINMIKDLNRLFKSNPQMTVFVLFCFACHGMIQDGRQVILVNEYSKAKGFYQFFGAEENMRMASQTFSNAYIVGVFACCREIFLVTQHSGCISLEDRNEILLQKRLQD